MSEHDRSASAQKFEFEDRHPATDHFLQDMLSGLARRPKKTLPKYLYDQRGAELFESICRTEEYYLTRTEIALLRKIAPEIAARAGGEAVVVEFGSGEMEKVKILLRALARPWAYIAIDIAKTQLLAQAGALAGDFPELHIKAVCADFLKPLDKIVVQRQNGKAAGLHLGFLPGSTIGNFEPEEALEFMRAIRASLGAGGALLIGVDLKKDPKLLEAAYNDKKGAGAAFNRNLLTRMRRELGAELDEADFEHEAHYHEGAERVEMRLRSRAGQMIRLAGQAFEFKPGEAVHTESSHKFSPEGFRDFARRAGFAPGPVWQDEKGLFSVHWLDIR